MDLNAALILVRIVDKGSFTAAAQELGMTKATVSRRIAELEQHLGVRLLYRSTRQLTLTEAGEQYYLRCSKAVEELAQAELMLSASQQEVTGTLKLAVPIETGQLVVGRLVAHFLQAYPGLRVDLELTNRIVDPISEGLDAIVRIGDMSDSSLAARRLWSTGRLLCASPEYLARCGVPQTPSDLARHECLSLGLQRGWMLRPSPEAAPVAVKIGGRFACNDGTVLHEWASRTGQSTLLRTLFALGPVLAMAWMFAAYLRFLRDCDELERRIELGALAWAAGITLQAAMAAMLLLDAGVAGWSGRHVAAWLCLVLAIAYVLVRGWLHRRYA